MAEIACKAGIIKAESLEYIQGSQGINIGVEYLHYAKEPLNGIINNDTFIKDIAHIDNYIMNCDRAEGNINILQDASNQKKYYAIDFGNALADGVCYEKILNGETDLFIAGEYRDCNSTLSKRYILKEDTKRLIKRGRNIKENIANIRKELTNIIDTFPPEWEVSEHKESIINIITSRIKSKKIFEVTATSKCECLY